MVLVLRGEINMEEYNDQIEGRNAVLEYLESGKDINKILVATGEKHGSINKIIAIAKDRKIIITEIEKSKLNKIAQTENSQGVIAIVPPYDYCEVEDILQNVIWKHFIQRDLTKEETKLVFEIDDEMLSLELKELLNDEINRNYLKLQRKVDLSFVAFETIENEFIEFYKETMEI